PPLAELQGFPLEQPNPIPVLPRQVKPERQALAGVVGRGASPGATLCHFSPQHLPKERLFVAKIVVEHPLVDRRAARNSVYARSGEAFGGKLPECGPQNSLLRSFRVPRPRLRRRPERMDGVLVVFQADPTISACKS